MPDLAQLAYALGLVAIAAPFVLVALLGVPSLAGRPLSEPATGRAVTVAGFVAVVGVFVTMLANGDRHVVIDLGSWVSLPKYGHEHFDFTVKF